MMMQPLSAVACWPIRRLESNLKEPVHEKTAAAEAAAASQAEGRGSGRQ